jgi:hypothetical protein
VLRRHTSVALTGDELSERLQTVFKLFINLGNPAPARKFFKGSNPLRLEAMASVVLPA